MGTFSNIKDVFKWMCSHILYFGIHIYSDWLIRAIAEEGISKLVKATMGYVKSV